MHLLCPELMLRPCGPQIHESYGVEQHKDTTFINAACVDLKYTAQSVRPVVFDIQTHA